MVQLSPERKYLETSGLTVQVSGTACEIPGMPAPGSFHTHWQPMEG